MVEREDELLKLSFKVGILDSGTGVIQGQPDLHSKLQGKPGLFGKTYLKTNKQLKS